MLRLQVDRRLGAFALSAALEAAAGSVLVLVGGSGSGKSTLLRLLAGLLAPERGRIEVDGEAWFDAEAGVEVPAHARAVGYVAQDHALFPHLTVLENVAFGLRAEGRRGRGVHGRAHAALARLGVADLAARRPQALSGGQQQRVAIARAIVLAPRLLLLDEPLSALDPRTRRGVRAELRRLVAELGCTTVWVTHSPGEALALGESIAVLEDGRITQCGTREDLMRHPRSAYVAEFLGVNLFHGSLARAEDAAPGAIALPGGRLALGGEAGPGEIAIVVRPRDVTVALAPPAGSARNVFEGVIEELAPEPPAGELVRLSLGTHPPLVAEVTREAVETLHLAPGVRVFASFKAAGVELEP